MWIKESWDDVDINLDNVSQEMIVGPSNLVARKMSHINERYVTATYLGGNRSMVEPLKPLSFTRTYRWSPGYKDTIKQVLWDKLYQYGKKTGTIETMFNRERNAQYNTNHFKDQLLEVDNLLKELRMRKATTDTDVETAKQIVQDILDKMHNKMDEADLVFGLDPNIEHEFSFRYYRNERIEEITDEQRQLLRFLTGELELRLIYKNVEIPIVNSHLNKSYGTLEFSEDIHLSFNMPFYVLFQSLFTKDFDTLTGQDVYGDRYTLRRMIDNHLIASGLSTNQSSFRFTDNANLGWGGSKELSGSRSFPYISSSNVSNPDDMDRMHHVCYGNMDQDVKNAFVRLDFVSLADNLSHWMSYDLHDTNPLNQLSYSFVTIPEDKFNSDLLEDYGSLDFEYMHTNLIGDFLPDNISSCPKIDYSNDSWMPRHNTFDYALWAYGNVKKDDRQYGVQFGWDFMNEKYVPNHIQVNETLSYMVHEGIIDSDELELEESELRYKVNLSTLNRYYEFWYSILSAVDLILEEDKCLSRTYGYSVAIKRNIAYIEDGMPKLGKTDVQVLEEQLQEKLVDPLQTVNVDPDADLPFGSVEITDPDPDDEDLYEMDYPTTETAHLSVEEIQHRMDQQMMEDVT